MSQLIIDRIEGTVAVCEKGDGSMIDIALDELPSGVKQGDVLEKKGSEYVVDKAAGAKRKARIEKKMNDLFKD